MAESDFLRNPQLEAHHFKKRAYFVMLLMAFFMVLLGARLFYLQSMSNEHYTVLSHENRMRIVPVPPVRGVIYDRNLQLLAGNRPSYQIEVTPVQVDDIEQVIIDISKYVQLENHHLAEFYKDVKHKQAFESIPLKVNVSEEEIARFSVNRHRFPGVEITALVNRYYPLTGTSAHALGYVSRINVQEVQTLDKRNYSGTTHVGKSGVEKFYEDILHGQVGYQRVEINAQGRTLRVLETIPPTPGSDLILSIDAHLQQVAQESLEGRKGSVIAMDPHTGEVLVFISAPAFDPNPFVSGISSRQYSLLHNDPGRPLFNRALTGLYPPGSTIKPMLALAGLHYQVTSAEKTMFAGPFFQLRGHKRKYRDWKESGHGWVDMYKAIAQSCDVYFYTLAHDLGIDHIAEFLTRFNFGAKTKIDSWGEVEGIVPSRQWKRSAYGQPWYPGETVITGIGQGYTLVTPLQLAVATSALATRGQLVRPRLLRAIHKQGEPVEMVPAAVTADIKVSNGNHWQQIISAMVDAVHKPNGTAYQIGKDAKYRIAGKTGTAQVFSLDEDEEYDEETIAEELRDHALFIGFAPVDNPRIAIAVIIENGGSGSKAASIAKIVMDRYLLNREDSLATAEL